MRILLRFMFSFITVWFFLHCETSFVLAAKNNLFGVHILFPEEVKEAAKLVNSKGGDWGYVVIPIQATDRSREKWQSFFADCRLLHLIPVVRIATYPDGANWARPGESEIIDFANFLTDLDWPTKKKIVVVYNEPNHAQEWGGQVDARDYALVLREAITEFKKRDANFVILNAGFDSAAPNSSITQNVYDFIDNMELADPKIFQDLDGYTAHAYPNPGFASSPQYTGQNSIMSYQYELQYLQNVYGVYGLKVYITETGWKQNSFLTPATIGQYYIQAFDSVWNQSYLIMVAPFVLKAEAGDFQGFSLIKNGTESEIFTAIAGLPKIKGEPEINYLPKNVMDEKLQTQKFVENPPTQKLQKTISVWKKIYNWLIQ